MQRKIISNEGKIGARRKTLSLKEEDRLHSRTNRQSVGPRGGRTRRGHGTHTWTLGFDPEDVLERFVGPVKQLVDYVSTRQMVLRASRCLSTGIRLSGLNVANFSENAKEAENEYISQTEKSIQNPGTFTTNCVNSPAPISFGYEPFHIDLSAGIVDLQFRELSLE